MNEEQSLVVIEQTENSLAQNRFQRLLKESASQQQGREANLGRDLRYSQESGFPQLKCSIERHHFEFPMVEVEGLQPQPVYGFRGVMVNFGHGLSLYDSSQSKSVCWTIGAYEKDSLGNEEFIRGINPAVLPIRYAEEYNAPGKPHADLLHAGTKGVRGKTCVECVQARENFILSADGESKNSCAPFCSMLFYVTEVLMRFEQREMVNGRRTVQSEDVWLSLASGGQRRAWVDMYGEPYYQKPVMVQFRLSAYQLRYQVKQSKNGEGNPVVYDLHRLKEGRAMVDYGLPAEQAKTLGKPYTPGDSEPWYTFFNRVLSRCGHLFEPLSLRVGGTEYHTQIFQEIVECYATRPIYIQNGSLSKIQNVAVIPTFRIAHVDKEYRNQALELARTEYIEGLRRAYSAPEDKDLEFYDQEEQKPEALPMATDEEGNGDSWANLVRDTVQSKIKR